MIFTDPPYGVAFGKHHLAKDKRMKKTQIRKGGAGFKHWGKIKGDESISTYLAFLEICAKKFNTISIYLCAPDRFQKAIIAKMDELGIYHATPIVWVKDHWVMSWERYHAQHEHIFFCGDGAHPTGKKSIWYGHINETTVWQITRDSIRGNPLHPTQKPVELVVRALLNSSLKGDVIYDAFGGSGSTLIACEQTGRTCYMMEIDPRYCQVIIDRWQAYTGQKAVKIGENNVSANSNRENS